MANSSPTRIGTAFRVIPGAIESPLVIDVSRSGTRYPPEFQPSAPFHNVHRKISPYVEQMVLPSTTEGATLLMAEFPPSFVDPNRPIDDIDPEILDGEWATAVNPLKGSLQSGSGLIHTLGADYAPLYETKLPIRDVERRIANYYTPYHEALSDLLAQKRQRFGAAFQLTCHSMSSVGPRDGSSRPQICLGDLDGTTSGPTYLNTVAEIFGSEGFEVAVNKPFRGNELLRRHGSPSTGSYSLQVEIRRDLYLDEVTRELHDGLTLLKRCFRQVATTISAMA